MILKIIILALLSLNIVLCSTNVLVVMFDKQNKKVIEAIPFIIAFITLLLILIDT